MSRGGIGRLATRLIETDPENTYSLDSYMSRPGTNDEEREEMKEYLRTAVKVMLTKKQKEAIYLLLDGNNVTQISLIMKVNKSTTCRTLKRAIKRLIKAKPLIIN